MKLTRRSFISLVGLSGMGLLLSGCGLTSSGQANEEGSESMGVKPIEAHHLDAQSALSELVNHEAFEGKGYLLLPWYGERENLDEPFESVSRYMVYHNNFNTESMLSAVNRLIDDAAAGNRVFYPVYSKEERAQNPDLEDVGLFYFRGAEGRPFAVVNPGGGFAYVGALHESMPHAELLSNAGYHAFSLSYRAGSGDWAVADLAHAVAFIVNRADEFGLNVDGYSLWGGSAGARMASMVGTYGSAAFGADDTPQAGTVVMAYTGQSSYTKYDPPTYSVVGENDGIASARVMQQRIRNLQNAGVPAEIQVFPNLGHGFGLGIGTSAENWLNDAREFWEREGLGW